MAAETSLSSRVNIGAVLRTRVGSAGAGFVALALLAVLSSIADVSLFSVFVDGIQVGVIYALVSVGISLVYKSTKVLNFAQGEVGTIAAFTVFLGLAARTRAAAGGEGGLREVSLDAAYPFALMLGLTLAAIVIGALVAILVNVAVVSRLASAAPVTSLVATIGVALLFAGSQILIFEPLPRPFPTFTEGGPPGLELFGLCLGNVVEGACETGSGTILVVGGANVTYQFLLTTIVLVLVSIGLATFFRTPVGTALLATSQEPFAAQLQGVSLRSMSVLAWGTAGAFGALAGVLAAGAAERIFPGFMTATVLIPAIVASVLGGITSVPGAVVGAVLLGLVQTYANSLVLAQGWSVPGPPQLATFAVLLLVLLVRPRGLLGKEA